MEIKLCDQQDIGQWMALVERIKESFPGLETSEALDAHRKTVLDFMKNDSAICAKCKDSLVGALLFSKEQNTLCFLAVHPEFRRKHIAEKMVSHMLTFLEGTGDITVTTYRDGVPEGIAARAFYKQLGFVEGRLTEEFGSPVQEFILKR